MAWRHRLATFNEIHSYCRVLAFVLDSHHSDIQSTAQHSHCVNKICGHRTKKRNKESSSSACDHRFVVSRELTFHGTQKVSLLLSSLLLSLSSHSLMFFTIVYLSKNFKCNSVINSQQNDSWCPGVLGWSHQLDLHWAAFPTPTSVRDWMGSEGKSASTFRPSNISAHRQVAILLAA